MQVIYIDVLLIINSMMNLFIFKIAAKILNHHIPIYRLMIGSSLAGLVGCLNLILPLFGLFPDWVWQGLTPILSILYMYKPDTLKKYLKIYTVSMVVAWVIGGVSFNLYYTMQYYLRVDSWILPVISACVLWILVEVSLTWIRKRSIGVQCEYRVTMQHNGKVLTLNGFLDTGNQLYTLNHEPVMVVALEDISGLLSDSTVNLIDACEVGDPVRILLDRQDKKMDLKLIPYDSLGKKNGIIIGLPIERIYMKQGMYQQLLQNCIVAVAPKKLFRDDMYKVLIHPAFISQE